VTETLAKAVLLLGAVGWFVIRYPHQRRARKTPVRKSARDVREILLLSISAVGLGIVPFLYILTGVPRFADRPFIPALRGAARCCSRRRCGCFTQRTASSAATGR